MTRRTHLRVLGPHRFGVEVRTMRVHGRVTPQTVTFDVARNACLEILPGRLAMSARKTGLRVVIPRSDTTYRRQACLDVAALAELRRIVAVST